MASRASALEGHYKLGRFGADGDVGVTLTEVRDLTLQQIAAWPDTLSEVAAIAAEAVGAASAPGPCRAETGNNGTLLRVEPLKWWVYGTQAPIINDEQGAILDLSHARTHLRVSGPNAVDLLKRLFPIDFREHAFPVNSVASSTFHHVGTTLWRSEKGYDLFVPRGYGLSIWESVVETAEQFGAEVV